MKIIIFEQAKKVLYAKRGILSIKIIFSALALPTTALFYTFYYCFRQFLDFSIAAYVVTLAILGFVYWLSYGRLAENEDMVFWRWLRAYGDRCGILNPIALVFGIWFTIVPSNLLWLAVILLILSVLFALFAFLDCKTQK